MQREGNGKNMPVMTRQHTDIVAKFAGAGGGSSMVPRLLLLFHCLLASVSSSGAAYANCSRLSPVVAAPRLWKWDVGTPGPQRHGHTAERVQTSATSNVEAIAVFGGADTNGNVDDSALHIHFPHNATWAVQTMAGSGVPTARAFHSSFTNPNNPGIMVLHGGLGNNNAFLDDMWLADFRASTANGSEWRQVEMVGEVPAARYAHSLTVLATGAANKSLEAVSFGGLTAGHTPSNALHYAQFSKNGTSVRWISASFAGEVYTGKTGEATGQPDARAYHAMAPWDGTAPCTLVFGGQNARIQRVYSDTWKLCLLGVNETGAGVEATFNWTRLSALHGIAPAARYGLTLTVVDPGRLFAFGGSSKISPPTYQAGGYLFDSRLGIWEELAVTTHSGAADPRVSHAMAVTSDGVHLLGGYLASGAVDDHSILNLTSSVCSAGFYMHRCGTESSAVVVCFHCSAGYVSRQAGAYECVRCSAGRYSGASAASFCNNCSTGRYSTAAAATNVSTCLPCAPGRFSKIVAAPSVSSCVNCSAGSVQPHEASVECRECRAGTFPNAAATACLPCAAGRHASTKASSFCVECSAGTYSPANASTCSACQAGEFSSDGSASCLSCAAGYYSAAGYGSCSPCDPGTWSSRRASNCTRCEAGKASDEIASNTSSKCLECPAGYFAPSKGSVSCSSCPEGTYNNDTMATACLECPRNTYQPGVAAEKETACISCDVGTYTVGPGKASRDSCYSCPPGRHADPSAAGCISCERGRFTDSYAAAANFSCVECAASTYAPTIGRSNCTNCPFGAYAHRGHAACIPCEYNASIWPEDNLSPTGYLQDFQPDDAALWHLDGSSPGASLDRWRSAVGPLIGSSDSVLNLTNTDNKTCVRAYEEVTIGVENRLLFVYRGFARVRATSPNVVRHINMTLRVGTRKEVASGGAAVVASLAISPSSEWQGQQTSVYPARVEAGGIARATLEFCGAGSVEFAGVSLFTAPTFACACNGATYVSAYNTETGAVSCTRCNAGSACSGGGTTPCSGGTFSFGGAAACAPCRQGWSCRNGLSLPCGAVGEVESGSTGQCFSCPPGHRCNNGVAYTCPVGKWSPGGMHALECLNCLPGYVANHTGALNCTACDAGRASNFGTSRCFLCQPGEFSRSGGACQTCPRGSFSAAGSSNCTMCSAGRYSPGPGMWKCLACDNATSAQGSRSVVRGAADPSCKA